MDKNKPEVGDVALVIVGCGCFCGGIAAYFWPAAVVYVSVAAMGLPALLMGVVLFGQRTAEASLSRQEREAQIEQTQTVNYSRWLANQERERKLNGVRAGQPDYRNDWREARHRFILWGAAYGFTIREMAADDSLHKCIAWDDWAVMRDDLIGVGVLSGLGNRTKFAAGWNLARWERERDTLPCPNRPAPVVSIPHHNTTPQQPQQAPTAAATAE